MAARAAGPVDVGNRSQLFIDRALVQSAENVAFNLHPAKKHAKGPWLKGSEGGPAGPMVLYDDQEKCFKSWSPTAYNTSKDGLRWEPSQANDESWRYIVRVNVIKDPQDLDPARRYKLITFGPNRELPAGLSDSDKITNPDGSQSMLWECKGYNTCVSPDGRKLTHLSQKPLLYFEDGRPMFERISGYYDRQRTLFVAFPKTERLKIKTKSSKVTGQRYAFSMITSQDFQNWSEPQLMLKPDERDDAGAMARLDEVRPLLMGPTDPAWVKSQIYATGGVYQQESCVLLFFWILTHNEKKADGPSEVQFAVSRELQHWERPFRQPVIPRGKVGKSYADSAWDSCWFNNVGPGIEVDDEVWVYYSAANTPHAHPATFGGGGASRSDRGKIYFSGIGLATWKRDRFVSVDATPTGGTLTTVPVVFQGSRLELNAATRPGGEVVVELVDKAGKLLRHSKPFSGDALRHRVQWESPLDLARLAGTQISLQFRMKSAELYAFAFRE